MSARLSDQAGYTVAVRVPNAWAWIVRKVRSAIGGAPDAALRRLVLYAIIGGVIVATAPNGLAVIAIVALVLLVAEDAGL